ncbi:MAG: hypothetical protein K2K81_11450 [Muribaculaceae bacterium]|nr:hypothetical protein [Muribaculaceae bacterium]
MKFKLLHKILNRIPAAAAMLAIGMLSACGNDPLTDITPGDLSNIDVSIRLTAGNQNSTRSELPEILGTSLENKIDLNDLKVLIFDDSGTLRDILYDGRPTDDNVRLLQIDAVDYVLTAALDPMKYSLTDNLAVGALVNWNSMQEDGIALETDVTTISDLEKKTFSLNAAGASEDDSPVSWIPEEDSLIPMFGILYTSLKGYLPSVFNKGNPMDLGTVNLLRSVVKIEIIDNSTNEDVQITSILLKGRNTRGYLSPVLHDKENTGQIVSPNIPGPSTSILSTDAGFTDDAITFHKEDNKYIAYVPEIRLARDLNDRGYVVVNIRYHNYDDERYIMLAPYNAERVPYHPEEGWPDEWKALLRNHIYRFTINSITADPNLDLTVDVQPFSSVELLVDFGLERTEDGYIVVRNSKGEIIKYICTDGSILTMAEDNRWPYLGTFKGVFDSSKRVLIGYFEDGRSIIFNYTSDAIDDNDVTKNLDSWEIYSSPTLEENGRLIPEHLQETFNFVDYYNDGDEGGDVVKYAYTHTQLDDKGRVVEEYRYATLSDFQHHKENKTEYTRTKLADFKGNRYGDKVITYYKENGEIICQIKVTGENEEYIYDNFEK